MMLNLNNYKARNFLANWGKDVDEFVMGTEWPKPCTPLYDELVVPAWVDPEKRAEARRRREARRGGVPMTADLAGKIIAAKYKSLPFRRMMSEPVNLGLFRKFP